MTSGPPLYYLRASLTGLEGELAASEGPAPPSRPVARVPVSTPPSPDAVPRGPVKETHVSGRFRAVERERPVPPVPPPLPPTRKKISE